MTKFQRFILVLLSIGLVTLPLQQAWIRPLEIAGAPAWLTLLLTNWVAPIILALAVAVIWRLRPLAKPDYWLLAFLVIAILPAAWNLTNIPDLAIGWRYTVFAMLGYWIGRGRFVELETLERWLHIALWLAIGFGGIQLIAWWLGNQALITNLGLEPSFAAGDWWRLYGPMSGPNQFGTFLAISGAWLYWRGRLTKRELVFVIALVVLTFSRSAFLGLAAGLIVTAVLFAQQAKQRLWALAILIIGVLVGSVLINAVPSLREGLVDARRADLRFTLLADTAEHFQDSTVGEWLVGHGAGTAGPAASVLNNGGFIPENWFFQIAYEFGLLGLFAIVAFMVVLFWQANRYRQKGVAAIILVIVINCLFLHPLSDNFATALWFYLLLGAAVTKQAHQVE